MSWRIGVDSGLGRTFSNATVSVMVSSLSQDCNGRYMTRAMVHITDDRLISRNQHSDC